MRAASSLLRVADVRPTTGWRAGLLVAEAH
jgi:hypothetical protein